MSERLISLREDVYSALLEASQKNGVTPADWIASKLRAVPSKERPLSELLVGLVGAINSQEEPHHQFQKTPFGEGVADKLAKQGLRRP